MSLLRAISAIAAFAAFGSASSACAHDQWADGAEIPAWVKKECCSQADAHHLMPSQVHVTPSGYRVDGYQDDIPEGRLLPSPDGEWWVFYHDYESGDQSLVYCFFGPLPGS